MYLRRFHPRRPSAFLLTLIMLLLGTAVAADDSDSDSDSDSDRVTVDVACDANTFVFQGPSTAAGPAAGASFVVQGVIYPEGTLAANGSSSGLLADGTPEFPNEVIGTWTCQGHFVGEGFAAQSGVFVVTTQHFDLDGDEPGKKTIVTHGIELIDLNEPFKRAITGGSGPFDRAEGESTQTAVGVNATGLFNFTFDLELE